MRWLVKLYHSPYLLRYQVPNITFHARSDDGKSGEYVSLDLMKDGHVLGTWRLTHIEAINLARELFPPCVCGITNMICAVHEDTA